ncbi:MAG: SpoIID/LytB domain-containing protein [Thermodesulfovibrionia bacterium]
MAFIISLLLILSLNVEAGSIKVLMLKDPNLPLPSEGARSLGTVNGKIIVNGEVYSGNLEVIGDSNGLYVIKELPLEDYVEGVVSAEGGKDWELEALKAQAVIARTYAILYIENNPKKGFHLTSTIMNQAYKEGDNSPLIKRAVKETEGEVLVYNDRPINALYHSVCVGKTEIPEEVWGNDYPTVTSPPGTVTSPPGTVTSPPYLKSVDCNTKDTPYDNWQRRFSIPNLERAIGIDGIKDIEVVDYTLTGRVRTLRFKTEGSLIEIKATELRRMLGYKELPSTDFSVRIEGDSVIFDGRGWGHGVGLSQWGAQEMAKNGKDYREILEHFYPGAVIKKQ